MKKIFKIMTLALVGVFALASCGDDVPKGDTVLPAIRPLPCGAPIICTPSILLLSIKHLVYFLELFCHPCFFGCLMNFFWELAINLSGDCLDFL